jgi:hypothetical protein
MAFRGPEAADYKNVIALNQAWLSLLQRDSELRRGLAGLPDTLQSRLTNLSEQQIVRLAATPFLLFSFRESDDRYWTRILSVDSSRNLFAIGSSEEVDTLVSAGLGFVWQLAQRNPYTLRLICGATLYWSERIAERTFYSLLDAVRAAGDVPCIRLPRHREFWRKLLDSGVGHENLARHAAHISALQAILTRPSASRSENWPLAARSANIPHLRVAEANETTQD